MMKLKHGTLKNLVKRKSAVAALIFLLVIVLQAVLAPWIAPYGYDETSELAFSPPGIEHPFGTDIHGRDLLTRVMYGSRISLMVALVAAGVSLLIGVTYGIAAGYAGGRIDECMMRAVDVLYSLPYMFFVIVLLTVFGKNIYNLFLAIGAVQWLTMSRIVRGQMLVLKEREFIKASRALGSPHLRIILCHMLPNLMAYVVVYLTLTIPAIILQESFLSFLGLGVQPPDSSWGVLIADGASVINPVRIYWWMILFPGLVMSLCLLSLNVIGDTLRDILDPRLQ